MAHGVAIALRSEFDNAFGFEAASLGKLRPVKAPDTLWELVFLMVILKIPIAYLCYVVWYAIKAEPRGRGGPAGVRVIPDSPPPSYDRLRPRSRRRPPRPHGGPARVYARTARAAAARADRIADR
jgi:hypothetical protein